MNIVSVHNLLVFGSKMINFSSQRQQVPTQGLKVYVTKINNKRRGTVETEILNMLFKVKISRSRPHSEVESKIT